MLLLVLAILGGEDPGRVDPDRPNIANSTQTVAAGAVQVEAGVDAQLRGHARGDHLRISAPLLLRIGVHRIAEVRLVEGDPWRWAQGRIGARQQGEISVGAKVRVFEYKAVSLGLQPQLVPVPPRTNAHFWAPLPGLVLLSTLAPSHWHIDLNLGAKLKVAGSGACCDVEGLAAASFGRDFFKEHLLVWAESYARFDVARGALSEIAGDAGIIVTVARRVAIDAATVLGQVGGGHPELAVIAGISVRLGPRG